MGTGPQKTEPLPVIQIIYAAFYFVWVKRGRMLRALFIPAIAIFVLDFVPDLIDLDFSDSAPWGSFWVVWFYYLLTLVPYILFAITCHRLALIGNSGVPKYGNLTWSKRESHFLGWLLVIWIVGMFIGFALNSILNSIVVSNTVIDVEAGANFEPTEPTWFLTTLLYIPILYVFSRFSVVYPATALDRQVDMKWAWELTVHNDWRLTIVVGLLPWILYSLMEFLVRDNATFIEYCLFELAGLILLAVEIVVVSFSYKHLAATET